MFHDIFLCLKILFLPCKSCMKQEVRKQQHIDVQDATLFMKMSLDHFLMKKMAPLLLISNCDFYDWLPSAHPGSISCFLSHVNNVTRHKSDSKRTTKWKSACLLAIFCLIRLNNNINYGNFDKMRIPFRCLILRFCPQFRYSGKSLALLK